MTASADKMNAGPRRRTAADMDLSGWSQDASASFLDAAQASVSRDRDEVRAEWRPGTTFDFDEARAGELQTTDLIERGDPIQNDDEARSPLQREHCLRTAALDPSLGVKSRRGDCSAFVMPLNHFENRFPKRMRIRRLDPGIRKRDVYVGENLCTPAGAPSIIRRSALCDDPRKDGKPVSFRPRRGRSTMARRRALTCLIQEQETLGIVPVFWKDETQDDDDCGAILRLSRQSPSRSPPDGVESGPWTRIARGRAYFSGWRRRLSSFSSFTHCPSDRTSGSIGDLRKSNPIGWTMGQTLFSRRWPICINGAIYRLAPGTTIISIGASR